MEKTKNHNDKVLTFCICYDGRDEITQAIKEITKNYGGDGIKINEELVKRHLFTKELPPVDLVIRTGGEKRLSGFLLWDISYAELYFTDILFPDSVPEIFDLALKEYKERKRKFGK